jgi:hypothetical protein
MNILSVLRNVLLSSALVWGFSFCAKPVEEKDEKIESIVQNLNDDLEGDEGLRLAKIDSVFEFQKYINLTKYRLDQNTKNLDDIKSEFKSDKSKVRLAFEGELFNLNKKNLELKSRVNDSQKSQNNLVDTNYIELDKEIDILESSIIDLRKRGE